MKTSSDDLHRLIHSLSKSEKGYFKKYVKRFGGNGDSNNIRIFDAVSDMDVYDEEKLKKKFKKESFISHFPVIKKYLYHQILQALYLYSSDRTVDGKMRETINEVDVLYNKGLFRQAHKLLLKVEEQAWLYEKYPIMFQLTGYKKNLIINLYPKDREEKLNELFKNETYLIECSSKSSRYSWIYDRICYLNDKIGYIRNKKEKKLFDDIISDPLLAKESNAVTYRMKLYYYDIFSVYYYSNADFQKVYEYSLKILDLYMLNPERLKISISNYIMCLANHVQFCSKLGKYEEAEDATLLLKQIVKNKKYDITEYIVPLVMGRNLFIMLDMYIASRNFDMAAAAAKEMIQFLNTSEELMDKLDRIFAKSLIAQYYFTIGDFNKSLEYVNLILNSEEEDALSEVYCSVKMLNLILHYELRNFALIEYLLKPTRKYISKRDKLYELENITLWFFSNVIKAVDESEERKLFDEFIYKLRKNIYSKKDGSAPENLNFIAWAESKLGGYKSLYEFQSSLQSRAV